MKKAEKEKHTIETLVKRLDIYPKFKAVAALRKTSVTAALSDAINLYLLKYSK